MSYSTAEVIWERGDQDFLEKRYARKHLWRFDGGVEVAGSSSPGIVPLPYSDAAAIDPEEALLASLSSCHMLWFLSLAAKAGYRVDRYRDKAVGEMGKDAAGKMMVAIISLHPEAHFSGDRIPGRTEITALHEAAHGECFIATSLKSDVRVEPVILPD